MNGMVWLDCWGPEGNIIRRLVTRNSGERYVDGLFRMGIDCEDLCSM